MMSSSQSITFNLGNDLSELSRIAAEVTSIGRKQNWPDRLISNTILILDELVTNSISYGELDDKADAIRISMSVSENELTIMLQDDGNPFNPFEEASIPDLDLDLEDRPIGGLGVFFVKTLTSQHDYQRIDGQNRITLVQEIAGT